MYVTVRDRPGKSDPATGGARRRVASTVFLLGIVSLLTDVSSEMVVAVLPMYLTAEIGLSILAYGFIDGLYQGVSALVRIAGGYLGDRTRRPKWVAVAGYGVSAVSRIALLPAHGFAAITAVITADRLGKGLRTAPRDALIANASDPDMVGRSFGVHRALDTLGAAAGPLLAFALLSYVTPGSYDAVFVVSFAFAVVGVAVLVLLVPDRRVTTKERAVRAKEIFREIAGPRLRRPLLAAGLLGLVTVGDSFLYLSLQDREQFNPQLFPLLYVGTSAAYLVLAVPFGRLADRIGRARVFIGGHLLLLAAYVAATAPLSGGVWTIATLVLLGSFYAATDGVLAALVSRLVGPAVRGSGIAAAQTVVVLARFAASVTFGALWYSLGVGPAMAIVAGTLTLVLPLAWWLLRSTHAAEAEPVATGSATESATGSAASPGDAAS